MTLPKARPTKAPDRDRSGRRTPGAPCWVVTFRSRLSSDSADYESAARRIADLAGRQPGFLGMESRRSEDGLGVTVCYWASREAIDAWRDHPDHLAAKEQGRRRWYTEWDVRIEFIADRS